MATGLEPQLALEPGSELATDAGVDTDTETDVGAEALPLHGEPMETMRDWEAPAHDADDGQPGSMAMGEPAPADIAAEDSADDAGVQEEPPAADMPFDGFPDEPTAPADALADAPADDGIAPSDEEAVPVAERAHGDDWPDEHRPDHPGETADRPENGTITGDNSANSDTTDTAQKPPAGVVYIGAENEPAPLPRRGWWQRLIDS